MKPPSFRFTSTAHSSAFDGETLLPVGWMRARYIVCDFFSLLDLAILIKPSLFSLLNRREGSSLLYRISLAAAKRIFGYLYEARHHRQSPWKVKRPSGGRIVEQRSLYGASESTLVLMIQGTHGTYGRLDVHFGEETPVRIAGVLRFRDESMKLKLEGCAEYLQQWSVSRLHFGCVYVRF